MESGLRQKLVLLRLGSKDCREFGSPTS
jgi:hypothetical protein